MQTSSSMNFAGRHRAKVQRVPMAPWTWRLRNACRRGYWAGWFAHRLAHMWTRATGMPVLLGKLSIRVFRADGSVENYGVVSYQKVTTAFVNFLVDQLQAETSEWGDFKYHDSGVGTTAESNGDTDIETTDGEARATGTQTEGASANIYRSVGTITYTTTKAITEHGLFSQVTGGTLMDRSVFSAINVNNGDSIQHTYELTASAEA